MEVGPPPRRLAHGRVAAEAVGVVTPRVHDGCMGSMADLGGWLAGLDGGLGSLSGSELADRLVELERVLRRTEAAIVAVVDEADRRSVCAVDGHASVRGWAAATVRWSPVELRDRQRCARLGRDLPDVLAALADGTVGVAQVRELARARANPRAGDQLAAAEAVLLDHAQHLPFEAFKTVVRRWEQLADADGAHRDHDDAHTGRHAAMCELGDSFHLDARFGAAQGVTMRNILDHFTDAEFAAEWAELTARYGDAATPAMLERTRHPTPRRRVGGHLRPGRRSRPRRRRTRPGRQHRHRRNHLARPPRPQPRRHDAELPDPATVDPEALPNRRRHPARPRRRHRRRRHRPHPPHGRQRRRRDHRPRTQLPLLHRQRPHRRAPPRGALHLPRLPNATARSTTPSPGPTAAVPARPTPGRSVPATTAGKHAATAPGATPTADGTPTDPTAPNSAPPDGRTSRRWEDESLRSSGASSS